MGYGSAEELVKGSKNDSVQTERLAEVTALDTKKRAKIRFFGEDTESGKSYTYIDGYVPAVGDKVLLISQGNTYIIIGAVVEKEVIVKYALKDHTHDQYAIATEVAEKNHNHDSSYAAKSHAHSEYAASGHTHSDYAASNHKHSAIYGTNRSLAFSDNVLIPDVTNALDLGSSSRQFRSFYAQAIYSSGVRIYPGTLQDTTTSGRSVELTGSNLLPSATQVISLGTSSKQFNNVYGKTIYSNGSVVTTSDKRKKKFIRKLPEKYLELFKKLRPVTFKYKNGTSGRTHAGFIAQEVEKSMEECDISREEFGGLVVQDNGEYGLRYEEFIALQTAVIQDLLKRVEELERRVKV